MSTGHVDPTIKTAVQNNTVFDAVLDATAIYNWRNELAAKIDGNYDDTQTKLDTKAPLITGTGTPIGVVTPTVIGQTYTDRSTGIIYTATGLTNTSWIIPIPYNAMTQQAIINAAMEVWQQGTTFTNPAHNAYTADMWAIHSINTGTLPTTIIHSQVTLTPGELPNTKYAYNVNVNGAGSGFGASDQYNQKHRIEFGTSKLCGSGKKITVSFYAKSNIAGKRIGIILQQNYGSGGSPSAIDTCTPTATTIRTLTSTMTLYTFTFTAATLTGKTFGTNNDDYLAIAIHEMWGTTLATTQMGGGTAETFVGAGDVTFTEVVVNAGDTALPYQPKSYNDELTACQYYYEKSYNKSVSPGTATTSGIIGYALLAADTTTPIASLFAFRSRKRVAPTVTIYDFAGNANKVSKALASGSTVDNTTATVTLVSEGSFEVFISGTAAVGFYFQYTADARL